VRVGLLGAGRIGAFHATTLLDHPDVAELVIGDVDAARATALADKLADRLAATASGGDVDSVFAAGVDAVVIAAATAAHAGLVVRAARAGLPAFCEKPIALDIAGTRAALEQVRASGTVLQVGFQRRFDAGYLAAREAVAAGAVGRLYTVRMTAFDREPPHESYIPTSGGVFRDLHIHDFDALRWVTGSEVVEVHAVGANLSPGAFDRYGDRDTTALLLMLDSGALVTLAGGRHNPAGYDIRMEVSGAGGTLAVGLDERTPLRSVQPGLSWPAEAPYAGFLDRFADAYVAEIRTFLDVARGRVPNPCTGAEALEALYVAEAAQRSADERRTVAVAEIRDAAADSTVDAARG
jgi:myo-inositol 2-dehydrogenase / D-chiro-inositol 1-dehydrogenase